MQILTVQCMLLCQCLPRTAVSVIHRLIDREEFEAVIGMPEDSCDSEEEGREDLQDFEQPE